MRPFLFTLILLAGCVNATAQDVDPDVDKDEGTDDQKLSFTDDDAEVTESGWNQFTASIGYLALDADGKFDIEGPNGNRVTVIDMDRLGIDDEDGSLWATLKWRSNSSKWGGWFGYWAFAGAGGRVWEEELIIGDDLVVPIGASVETELSTDWYILEATYSFVQNKNWDVGVGFGVHVVDIETTLNVGVSVGDEQREETVTRLGSLAPLPNVLGYAHYRFNDRLHLTARYGWFGLSYDEYDGEMNNFHALLRYNLSDRWAIEGGYQFVKLDVDINEENYTGYFDLDFKGPMGVLRFHF